MRAPGFAHKKVIIPFFIPHSGCPNRCVFCDQEKIAGTRGLPGSEQILSTVNSYLTGAPGRIFEAAFYGGTFTALPRGEQARMLGVLQPYLHTGEISSLRLSTRPDAVDAETLDFLKGMGVATVELGVQSMDDEVLALAGRGHSFADSSRAVRAVKAAGISVGVQLMPGLPGDTPERSLRSLAKVLELSPTFLRIYPTLVIEGTELAAMYRAGSYTPLALAEAVELAKKLSLMAQQAGVPVIRMGLQPTAELDAPGTLLAGPHHPAFGQLVEAEICHDLMARLLASISPGSTVTFFAPPGRVSDLVGQHRSNLLRLCARFSVEIEAVREDATLERQEIALETAGKRSVASRSELY